MKRLPFVLAFALVGCGYDYETFADELQTTMCDKMQECEMFTDYFTYEDCTAEPAEDTSAEEWVCEEYNSDAAKDCVDGWTTITCEDLTGGSTVDICADVCSNY